MAVAQNDGFSVCQADAQLEGVVQEQVALAGVEQEAARADLEVESQAVFGQQAAGMNAILDQRRDDNCLFHCAP